MKFGPVPLEQAEGKILGHNVAGETGRRLLRKGKPLTLDDLEALRAETYPGTDEEVILASAMMWIRNNRRNKDWAIYQSGVKM